MVVNLRYIQRTSLYLLGFLIVWLPATINRAHNMVHPEEPSFALYFLQAVPLNLSVNSSIDLRTVTGICFFWHLFLYVLFFVHCLIRRASVCSTFWPKR
jgi:hypothetical protein